MKSAFNALSEGVALFDRDGALVFANVSFERQNPRLEGLLHEGLSWEMFLREASHREVYPPDTCRELELGETDLLDGRAERHTLVTRSDGGGTFQLQLTVTADDGFVLTQSEQLDQSEEISAAREAENLLSRVLEASPASIVMSRIGDGQVIYRSPSATALLGSAKSSYTHFAHRADRADFVTALLPDARVDDMRVTGLRADGSEFPAAVSARLIEYRGEDVIVAHTEDLSEEIALQAKLSEQREQLFIAEKLAALGEMLAGIAHELNNPLSIILGNSEILIEDLEDRPEAPRVRKINTAAERCVRIVRSFLAMARHDPPDLGDHSLRDLVDAALEIVQPRAADAKVQLVVAIPDDFPFLHVDEVQIVQALVNLFNNAVDAIAASGVGSEVGLSVAHDPAQPRVILRVHDNGPGIEDSLKGKVFDPLFTTKEVGKGTGIGLSYCHRVIAAHGGSISLESGSQSGAVFRIELPAG